MHLSPTQVAITAFGSANRIMVALGIARSACYSWMKSSARNAPGDIPVRHIRTLLTVARERGIPLTERDLLFGRDLPDALPLGGIG